MGAPECVTQRSDDHFESPPGTTPGTNNNNERARRARRGRGFENGKAEAGKAEPVSFTIVVGGDREGGDSSLFSTFSSTCLVGSA